jgi:hypothetical protein
MRRGLPGPGFAETVLACYWWHSTMLVERQAVPGAGALWGGFDAGPGAGRASARFVSFSSWLSERSGA